MPPEESLAERLGVSRYQVRRALSRLVLEGELHPRRNRGYFLTIESVKIRLQRRSSYTAHQKAAKELPRSDLLDISLNYPKETAREALHLAPEDSVWMVHIRRFYRGIPVSITESVVPAALAPHLVRYFRSNASLHELLQSRYGLSLEREYSEVSAVAATPEEAGILSLPLDYPLLRISSVNVGPGSVPVEFAVASFRSDMVSFWAAPECDDRRASTTTSGVRTTPASHTFLTPR